MIGTQSQGSDRHHTIKVMALDRHSGETLWSDVAYAGAIYDDYMRDSSVASATPITDGELVYFYFGSEGVYAYDFDGNQVWAVDLGDLSYFGVGLGAPQLLTVGSQFLIAYDPRTGDELWRLCGLRNNAVHTPVWDGELVYVSTGYPRSVIRAIKPGRDAAEDVWEYNKGAAFTPRRP